MNETRGPNGVMFEVSLYDNPDREFVEAYEKTLKLIYSGKKLARYLSGERVSLTGSGVFNLDDKLHQGKTKYNPTDTLYFSWDFNVEYCAVSVGQQPFKMESGIPVGHITGAHQMREPTVRLSAENLAKMYAGHQGDIVLTGDASGENRTAAATEDLWAMVNNAFRDQFPGRVRKVLEEANPLVKDSIELCNWVLGSNLIIFDRDDARNAWRSMLATKYNKKGQIDKKADYEEGTVKTHEMDTIRYLLWLWYRGHWKRAMRPNDSSTRNKSRIGKARTGERI